jgi:hypothetical protein
VERAVGIQQSGGLVAPEKKRRYRERGLIRAIPWRSRASSAGVTVRMQMRRPSSSRVWMEASPHAPLQRRSLFWPPSCLSVIAHSLQAALLCEQAG